MKSFFLFLSTLLFSFVAFAYPQTIKLSGKLVSESHTLPVTVDLKLKKANEEKVKYQGTISYTHKNKIKTHKFDLKLDLEDQETEAYFYTGYSYYMDGQLYKLVSGEIIDLSFKAYASGGMDCRRTGPPEEGDDFCIPEPDVLVDSGTLVLQVH